MPIAARVPGILAKTTLWALVIIHFTLPFTPVNPHPELRIKIASAILGSIFLALALRARSRPALAYASGLTLLLVVYAVSALGGASPISEGWIVKLVFVLCLMGGLLDARMRTGPVDGYR